MVQFWNTVRNLWSSQLTPQSLTTDSVLVSEADRMPTPPSLVTISQATENIHTLLDIGITFFGQYDAPKPHGTDEFVRASIIEAGGHQRAALKAQQDIKRVKEQSLKKAKRQASVLSPAMASLTAILANSSCQTRPMTPARLRHGRDHDFEFADAQSPLEKHYQGKSQGKSYHNPSLSKLGPMAAGILRSADLSPEPTECNKPAEFRALFFNPWRRAPSVQPVRNSELQMAAQDQFSLDFPFGANTTGFCADRGVASAFMAVIHSLQYQLGLHNVQSQAARAVDEMLHLHDLYADVLIRQGRPVPQMGGRSGAFTPHTLATVVNRWGRSQYPPLDVSLGIISVDHIDDALHEGFLVSIDSDDGRRKKPEAVAVTIWIYHDGACGVGPDADSYNRRSVFKGMRKVESQLGMISHVRRLSYQSRQIMIRRWVNGAI